jgi:hypothetical protein
MARISTYPLDQDIVGEDKVIGSNSVGDITKNYTLNGISSWMNASGSVAITGQNNYGFGIPGATEGAISGVAPNTAFSAISNLTFTRTSGSGYNVIDYLLTLVGRSVILARLDNTDNFGVYKLVSLTVDSSNANLYDAVFTHIVSNGNITANKYYGFAIYPELSADKHFTFVQSTAAATWSITHNLGKFPSVSIVDSGNTIVHGDIDYTNENALTITFSAAFGGKAYLN